MARLTLPNLNATFTPRPIFCAARWTHPSSTISSSECFLKRCSDVFEAERKKYVQQEIAAALKLDELREKAKKDADEEVENPTWLLAACLVLILLMAISTKATRRHKRIVACFLGIVPPHSVCGSGNQSRAFLW